MLRQECPGPSPLSWWNEGSSIIMTWCLHTAIHGYHFSFFSAASRDIISTESCSSFCFSQVSDAWCFYFLDVVPVSLIALIWKRNTFLFYFLKLCSTRAGLRFFFQGLTNLQTELHINKWISHYTDYYRFLCTQMTLIWIDMNWHADILTCWDFYENMA